MGGQAQSLLMCGRATTSPSNLQYLNILKLYYASCGDINQGKFIRHTDKQQHSIVGKRTTLGSLVTPHIVFSRLHSYVIPYVSYQGGRHTSTAVWELSRWLIGSFAQFALPLVDNTLAPWCSPVMTTKFSMWSNLGNTAILNPCFDSAFSCSILRSSYCIKAADSPG